MVISPDDAHPAIARLWSGQVPIKHADGFYDHLLETGVAEARSLDGCLGATITKSTTAGTATFTLTTYWRNIKAMRAFSPSDEAVLYPGDEIFELVPDRKAAVVELTYHECHVGA